jgi:hypothetical protein
LEKKLYGDEARRNTTLEENISRLRMLTQTAITDRFDGVQVDWTSREPDCIDATAVQTSAAKAREECIV